MTDSRPWPGPAPKARIRRVAWFPTTRSGKAALTLAYVTVLSPAWVFLLLGQGIYMAGASDDVVIALLVGTVVALWSSLLWAKEHSILVAAFTVVLSAALMYFLWWVTTAPGSAA
ncbi:hypothetical protein [Arthrobacter sp. NicSoilB8]|uniref:hypothetical protein n=1 Tax=Arthrobacter sp. NicSoilB8 TaxID=2830998 RepID=UPI001CC7CF83|nr:hypothetical protein [Arthrobacter sp. NicSoilB8]BCW72603.1 hypothetical protein NicSoilB8_36470 [Arthrobacter sp. NicSoilB8]